jgi:hemolysin activation/secretion protein
LNYGDGAPSPQSRRHFCTVRIAVAAWPLLLSAIAPANAQQANQPGFDPRQTERRFDAPESGLAQPSRPGLRMPQLARPSGAADTRPQFDLREVVLTGAVAIPGAELIRAYQPYLGKKVSQADLVAIAGAISELYRAAGFHLSRAIIPPQDIRGGRVRIEIIEGSITEIALRGDDAGQFGIRKMLGPVLAECPSRLATLERQLLLINDRPGVRIADTAIEEIGGPTGHFRLIVEVKTWHIFTSLGVDNLGSSSVGPWQTYATAAFNSYLAPGDILALNLSTTPGDPRELAFGRLSYDVPVGTDGLRIGASALYSDVRQGDDRRLYNDNTQTEAFEVRASFAALQSQRSSLMLTAAADFSEVSERDVFGPIYNDHIRTLGLTSDFRLQDNFGGNNYFTLAYRQGLDIFGASQFGDDLVSHDGAAPNFSVLDFWFARYQTLSNAWSVKLAAAGQIASGPLFTSQQFYLGGANFGRGYGSAEISGDNGIAGSLELRFDQTLSYRYLSGYQLYSFLDAGAVWNDGFSISDGLSLTSAGGGVRFFLWDGLQADIGVAFPLGYRAPDNEWRSARLLFSLSSALKLCPERGRGNCL